MAPASLRFAPRARPRFPRAASLARTRRCWPPPAGCIELAGMEPDGATELGEVLLGTRPGRRSQEDITVYKSMGHAVEDLAAAALVYREAVARGVGSAVEL